MPLIVKLSSGTAVLNALIMAGATGTGEMAIGLLAAEAVDPSRSMVRALAFRSRGQYIGYGPDKRPDSFDRQNVRDGHYTIWSPTFWVDNIDGGGAPIDADARYVVGLLGTKPVTPTPGFSPVPIMAALGVIPDCAMRVTRTSEGGDLSPYVPPEPCGCFWEAARSALSPSCVACSPTNPCATGVCRLSFCEAQ